MCGVRMSLDTCQVMDRVSQLDHHKAVSELTRDVLQDDGHSLVRDIFTLKLTYCQMAIDS